MKNIGLKCVLVYFVVHGIFLISVFDIYFQSPIVNGIFSVKNEIDAPAKRIVLFVGDGVRSDKLFGYNENKTFIPYLRKIIEEKGRWGISHTRVPTESRPGHVAITAGFYEDPSAIFSGWKDNPIEFDTIFNQSKMTFAWGSPDILFMFNKGSAKDRITVDAYSSDMETFFGHENIAKKQSLWSFEKFKSTMKNEAKNNISLRSVLMDKKIIFFLHLLGVDTSGHNDKPASKEYLENIEITDNIVRDTVDIINEFYGTDNDTAFIYTSDHGMTDWGSHGDGSNVETETPFIAWGAGILPPENRSDYFSTDRAEEKNWKLDHLVRNDMEQIDIPSLMAVLIGVPIPVHSSGILPFNILNLDMNITNKALYLNAEQLYAHYRRKREIIEENTIKWLYVPFDDALLNNIKRSVEHRIRMNYKSDDLIHEIITLIISIRSGISYYHNYFQRPLLLTITLSYIGWIARLILYLLQPVEENIADAPPVKTVRFLLSVIRGIEGFLLMATLFLLSLQHLPKQYYVYFCLPVFIWSGVFQSSVKLYYDYNKSRFPVISIYKLITFMIVYGLATESLVLVFFERRALSVIMFISTLCQIIIKPIKQRSIFWLWIFSSIIICIFPLLPTIGAKPNNYYIFTTAVAWIVFYVMMRRYIMEKKIRFLTLQLFFLQLTVLFVACMTSLYLIKEEIPIYCRLLSWSALIILPLIPPLKKTETLLLHLVFTQISYGNIMLLFSVAHESLFMPCFAFHLIIWFIMEDINKRQNSQPILKMTKIGNNDSIYSKKCHGQNQIGLDDIRKAYFFFLYIVYSFFAVGNLASINSFDISAVRCFVKNFSPFTMTALLLIKIIIPFIAVNSVFKAINTTSEVAADKMFLVVLVFCSIMGLNFLFLVKNVGSWLEIGSSLSHYVIAQATTLFLLVIYFSTSIIYKSVYSGMYYYSAKYID